MKSPSCSTQDALSLSSPFLFRQDCLTVDVDARLMQELLRTRFSKNVEGRTAPLQVSLGYDEMTCGTVTSNGRSKQTSASVPLPGPTTNGKLAQKASSRRIGETESMEATSVSQVALSARKLRNEYSRSAHRERRAATVQESADTSEREKTNENDAKC